MSESSTLTEVTKLLMTGDLKVITKDVRMPKLLLAISYGSDTLLSSDRESSHLAVVNTSSWLGI